MSGPFDKARYEALLEGLEITVAKLSDVLENNQVFRVDSEYLSKAALCLLAKLHRYPLRHVAEITQAVTDGIHASIDFAEGSGIKLISAKHPKENYFALEGCDEIGQEQHDANPRTALRCGDVIISTVGTIGNAAVVDDSMLPANSDRHVGIIRANKDWQPEFISTFLLSKYGRFQTEREVTGNVQPNLFISKLKDLLIPELPSAFRETIQQTVMVAGKKRLESVSLMNSAEQSLLAALGLNDWQPPEPLTYTCGSKEVLEAGRFDSQYFAPRVAQLLARLGKDGLTVRDVAPPRIEKFSPASEGTFRYIEISDLQSNGTAACETIDMRDAPSRATWTVRSGDVLTSTVRPNRRLSALVTPEQDGCVASSGFVVLQPQRVAAEVLLTYLRLPVFCELMDLHTSASLYPAISDRDLLALPFPKITPRVSEEIVATVRSAHAVRRLAQVLLARAQRAVETAIEEGEAAGMRELNPPATRKR